MDYVIYASIDGHSLHHTVNSLATARSFAKKLFYCMPLMGFSIANGFKVAVLPANQFRRNARSKEAKVTTWYSCEIEHDKKRAKLYSCNGKGENTKPQPLTLSDCGFASEQEARFIHAWAAMRIS